MWKIIVKKACITVVIISSLLFIMKSPILFSHDWALKIIVHKAMNYNQYSIVIVSRIHYPNIWDSGELYADIWLNGIKTKSYYLLRMDVALEDYKERIKDITTLPDEGVIKVEFTELEYSKSKTGVDLYKIE